MSVSTQFVEKLYTENREDLIKFAESCLGSLSYEAEDYVQDAFAELLGSETEIRNPIEWLKKTISNMCADAVNRDRGFVYLDDLPDEPACPESEPEITEEQIALSISDLPDQLAQIFTMSQINQKSIEEISRETGIPFPTVYKKLQRAKSMLRSTLGPILEVA